MIIIKHYDSDPGSGLQLHTQSSPGERSGKFGQNGKFSQNGKFGQNGMSGQKGKVHLGPNVSTWVRVHGQWKWCYGSNMSIIIIIIIIIIKQLIFYIMHFVLLSLNVQK